MAIVMEYESGTATMSSVAKKYGIKNRTLIIKWRHRFLESMERATFAPSKLNRSMPKPKNALEQEIAELKKELEWCRLENKALNTLIDIAEEQGLHIRKKTGAKQ